MTTLLRIPLRSPRLDGARLSFTGVFGSSHNSVGSKYAQGAYVILLCERAFFQDAGGRCHVVEVFALDIPHTYDCRTFGGIHQNDNRRSDLKHTCDAFRLPFARA